MDRRGRWGGVWEFKRSSPDLIYDAAGEEGGRFLAVRVEVQRHQGVGAHGEVVVHGQDLRQTHNGSAQRHKTPKPAPTQEADLWFTKVDSL